MRTICRVSSGVVLSFLAFLCFSCPNPGGDPDPAVAVTGVTLNKSTTTLQINGTEQLIATVAPADAANQTVSWESLNDTVATVSDTGLVLAQATGTATIRVTTEEGGFTDTCDVTVNGIAVTGVTLNRSCVWMPGGGATIQLTATVTPADAENQNVNWTTTDGSIADVSSTGLVTTGLEGSATITVTTEDGGFTDTCIINSTSWNLIPGHQLSANETWNGNNILLGDISVPSGRTLTIQPGTVIKVVTTDLDWDGASHSGEAEIYNRGTIVAAGNLGSEIVLTSAAGTPAHGDWWGIGLSGSSASITLDYCCIAYAYRGIFVYSTVSTAPNITHTMFAYNDSGLIDFGPDSSYSYNTFLYSDFAGFNRYQSSETSDLSYCDFQGNDMADIFNTDTGTITTVDDSNFADAGHYNLLISGLASGVTITATNCYGITDVNDNGCGTITISSPASSPIVNAGCGFEPLDISLSISPISPNKAAVVDTEKIIRDMREENEREKHFVP